jgi:hypothetical protein
MKKENKKGRKKEGVGLSFVRPKIWSGQKWRIRQGGALSTEARTSLSALGSRIFLARVGLSALVPSILSVTKHLRDAKNSAESWDSLMGDIDAVSRRCGCCDRNSHRKAGAQQVMCTQ